MEPGIEQRLAAIEAKLTETQETVEKIRSVQRRANIMSLVYWAFIILLSLGAFYFIQPVLDQLKSVYNFDSNPDTGNFSEFLRQIQQ